jgi:hypothetical protein
MFGKSKLLVRAVGIDQAGFVNLVEQSLMIEFIIRTYLDAEVYGSEPVDGLTVFSWIILCVLNRS